MEETVVFLLLLAIANAIQGGHDTKINAHRWQLSLREEDKHFCGATLIDLYWGLTSAGCVRNRNDEKLSVKGGSANLTANDGFTVEIDQVIIHPDYDSVTHEADIALIHFVENVTDEAVLIAHLPYCDDCDIEQDTGTTMTGWGLTKDGGDYPEVLQMGFVSSISRDSCQGAYPMDVISLDMYCAGSYQEGYIQACEGDYGGPVMSNVRLAGIISWGNGCDDTIYPTVMTRIGKYNPWIRSVTGIPED